MCPLQVGEKLGRFEVEKRQAVENEDYDKAKLKKVQMEEYRLQMHNQLQLHDLLEFSPRVRYTLAQNFYYMCHVPSVEMLVRNFSIFVHAVNTSKFLAPV